MKKALVLAAAVALSGAALAAPGTASAATGELIRNADRLNGPCLDADLGEIDQSNTSVQVWSCHGNDNQRWSFNGSTGEIKTMWDQRCLEVPGKAEGGSPAQLWKCNGGRNQRWTYDANTRALRNGVHRLCLDAAGQRDGAKVTIQSCNPGQNQRWYFTS